MIPVDEFLQPGQHRQIHIAGGLVQQQYRWAAEQQTAKLELDPFPAREGGHRPAAVEFLYREPELPRNLPQLLGRQIIETWRRGAKVENAPRLLLLPQLLGQIAHRAGIPGQLPAPLAVALNTLRVINPLEQGGFPIALLPDQGGLVAVVEYKRKILHQGPQILLVGQCQMVDL